MCQSRIAVLLSLYLTWYECGGAPQPSPACGRPLAHGIVPGTVTDLSLTVIDSNQLLGAINRTYSLLVPSNYSPDGAPLKVLMYFGGWCEEWPCDGCSWAAVGERFGWAVVQPRAIADGPLPNQSCGSWNIGTGGLSDICIPSNSSEDLPSGNIYSSCVTVGQASGGCNCCTCYDDMAMIDAVLQRLREDVCLDSAETYVAGESNGAELAYYAATMRPGAFRAYLPWYGGFHRGMLHLPLQLHGASLHHFHGTQDTVVPVAGGQSQFGVLYEPLNATLAAWALLNVCDILPSVLLTPWDDDDAGPSCVEYLHCSDGRITACYFNEPHGFWKPYAEDLMAWMLSAETSTIASV